MRRTGAFVRYARQHFDSPKRYYILIRIVVQYQHNLEKHLLGWIIATYRVHATPNSLSHKWTGITCRRLAQTLCWEGTWGLLDWILVTFLKAIVLLAFNDLGR